MATRTLLASSVELLGAGNLHYHWYHLPLHVDRIASQGARVIGPTVGH